MILWQNLLHGNITLCNLWFNEKYTSLDINYLYHLEYIGIEYIGI